MKNIMGGTKLGMISTIFSIVGAIFVGAGSIGSTLNNNIVVAKTAAETTKQILSE